MQQITLTLTSAEGVVTRQTVVKPEGKPVQIKVPAGTKVDVQVQGPSQGKPAQAGAKHDLQLKQAGKNLLIEAEGEALVEVSDFYATPNTSVGEVSWNYAEPVANATGSSIEAKAAAEGSASEGLAGLAGLGMPVTLGLGAVGVAALVSGGGSSAVASNVVSGTFVAGPAVTGNNLVVKLYKTDGKTLLGQGTVDANGKFSIDVGSYTGAIVAQLVGTGGGVDYRDEATGLNVDLTTDLLAVGTVGAGGGTVNINPLTTMAAKKAGVTSANGTLGGAYNATEAATANTDVAEAFGLSGDVTKLDSTPVVRSNGTVNTAASDLGKVLAALSGLDVQNGSMDATISMFFSNGGLVDSSVIKQNLIKGAALTDAQIKADTGASAFLVQKVVALLNTTGSKQGYGINVIAGDDVIDAADAAFSGASTITFKVPAAVTTASAATGLEFWLPIEVAGALAKGSGKISVANGLAIYTLSSADAAALNKLTDGLVSFQLKSVGANAVVLLSERLVMVERADDAAIGINLVNQLASIYENTSTIGGKKVADIVVVDPDGKGKNSTYTDTSFKLDAEGASNFEVKQDPKTKKFELWLKSGVTLNYEDKLANHALTTTVTLDGTTAKTYTLAIADINEAPTAKGRIVDQTAVINQSTWQLDLSSYFADVDAADNVNEKLALTYSLSSGTLPAGLTLDRATGLISGTPTDIVGLKLFTVTATDKGGLSTTQNFNLQVVNAPVVQSFTVTGGDGKASQGKQGDTLTFTVILSEVVTYTAGTHTPEITFTMGGTPIVAKYSGLSGRVLTFTATAPVGNATEATLTGIDLKGATFTNGSGQNWVTSVTGQQAHYTLDNTPPTVIISSDKSALKANETATITFTFSEEVNNLSTTDINAPGGVLSGLVQSQSDKKVWTATYTPDSNVNGVSETISVKGSVTSDVAGNLLASTGNTNTSISVDTVAPTVIISSDKSSLKANETATITFTFSEEVNNLSTTDINAPGGVLSGLVQSQSDKKVWTATYTPDSNVNGVSETISVKGSVTSDVAGNLLASTGNTNTSISVDTVAPTVIISSDKSSLKANETATITFTFSEEVNNLSTTDINAPGGALSGLVQSQSDKKVWTATYTPDSNVNGVSETISVKGSVTSDVAGNLLASTGNTNTSISVDTVAPTVNISSDKSSLKANETATITFTFSEEVNNLSTTDINAPGGALSGLVQSQSDKKVWTATYTPDSNVNGVSETISVKGSVTSDVAGNLLASTGNTNTSISVDTYVTPPSFLLDPASDTGSDSTDGIFNNSSFTLKGVAENGATVKIWQGNTLVDTVTASVTDGTWSKTLTAQVTVSGLKTTSNKNSDANGTYTLLTAAEVAVLGAFSDGFSPQGSSVLDASRPVYKMTDANNSWYIWAREGSGYHISQQNSVTEWYWEYGANGSFANAPEFSQAWVRSNVTAANMLSTDASSLRSQNDGTHSFFQGSLTWTNLTGYGQHTYTATQTDVAKNTSSTALLTITVDTTAPVGGKAVFFAHVSSGVHDVDPSDAVTNQSSGDVLFGYQANLNSGEKFQYSINGTQWIDIAPEQVDAQQTQVVVRGLNLATSPLVRLRSVDEQGNVSPTLVTQQIEYDNQAPTIIGKNSGAIAPAGLLSLSFSDVVHAVRNGTITIYEEGGQLVETISVEDTNKVALTPTLSGSTASIRHTNLTAGKSYYALLSENAFADKAGNTVTPITDVKVWSFNAASLSTTVSFGGSNGSLTVDPANGINASELALLELSGTITNLAGATALAITRIVFHPDSGSDVILSSDLPTISDRNWTLSNKSAWVSQLVSGKHYTVTVELSGNLNNSLVTGNGSGEFDLSSSSPVINSVSFDKTSGTLKVGDTLTMTIHADAAGYTADTITINGKEVKASISDQGGGNYTVTYQVAEGDNDIADTAQIPVKVILKDAHGNANAGYTSAPVANDAPGIDAHPPVINSVSFDKTSGTLKVGDTLTMTIHADAAGYTADTITINGKEVKASISDQGGGNYTVTYQVAEGDNDIADTAQIPVKVILKDAHGNANAGYTSAPVANDAPGIDAHPPVISSVSFDKNQGQTLKVGDTLTMTIHADAAGYTADTITINGKEVKASISDQGGGNYTVTYQVAEGDNDIADTAQIPVKVILKDAHGNANAGYTSAPVANDAPGIDAHAPEVSSFDAPVDASDNNGTSGQLVFTFKERVVGQGLGNVFIKKLDTNETVATLDAREANITTNGNTTQARLAYSHLIAGVHYYIVVNAGAFKDEAGNEWVGTTQTGSQGWDFTTADPALSLDQIAGNNRVNADENSHIITLSGAITSSSQTPVYGNFSRTDFTITLTDTRNANNKITISSADIAYDTSTGQWHVDIAAGTLQNGITYTTQVKVANTNYPELVATQTVTVDTTPPELQSVVITASRKGQTYSGHLKAGDLVTVTATYDSEMEGDLTTAPTLNIGSEQGVSLNPGTVSANNKQVRTWSYVISATNSGANVPDTGSISVQGDFLTGLTDWVGNAVVRSSSYSTNGSFVVDTTPPTATLISTGVGPNTNTVNVQSSEPGSAYLIKSDVSINSLDAIANVATNQKATANIIAANTNTSLSLTGLIDGIYKLYVVDEAGNLSSSASSTYRVNTNAPTFTNQAVSISIRDTDGADTTANVSGTFTATDEERSALTYGISGGVGNANFTSNQITYDVSSHGTYGTLYLNSVTGAYIFVPNHNAIDAVAAGNIPTAAFTVTANDGSLDGTQILNISITGANDVPTVTGTTSTKTFTEMAGADTGANAQVINNSVVVGDLDGGSEIVSATVTITNEQAGDVLSFAGDTTKFDASYNAGTLTLTVKSGQTASNADFQAALRNVKFNNTSDTPSTTPRTVTFKVTDKDTATSTTFLSETVNVVATNDVPTVTGTTSTKTFTEMAGADTGANAQVINNSVVVDDLDGGSEIVSATVTITNEQAGDVLSFAGDTTKFDASYNAGTLTLTVKSGQTASNADFQAALRNVKFNNTSDTPSTTPRTVTFKVTDKDTATSTTFLSETVNVVATNDVPTVTGTTSTKTFTEMAGADTGANAQVINNSVVVGDLDGGSEIVSATVTITNEQAGDVLSFAGDTTKFDASYNAGTLTLTVKSGQTASNADFQAALRNVKFNNTSDTPSTTPRTVTFKVTDKDTATSTTFLSETVNVVATNDVPTVTGTTSTKTFTEMAGADTGANAQVINNSVVVGDLDGGSEIVSATVTITNEQAGDVLSFAGDTTKFDASYNAGTLTLTVKSGQTASNADFQAALRNVKFNNTSDTPSTTPRTVTFKVTDKDTATSTTFLSETVNVVATNDVPTVTGTTSTKTFTEMAGADTGANAQVINNSVVVGDLDGGSEIVSATVTITNEQAGDVLSFAGDTTKFDASYNAGTLTLTVKSGQTASNADFQAALRTVRFNNTSDTPNTTARTITFKASDSVATSTTFLSETVNVVAVPEVTSIVITGLASDGVSTKSSLKQGDIVRVTFSVDQTITVAGTTETLASVFLDVGGVPKSAIYNSTASAAATTAASATRLVFDYIVESNTNDNVGGITLSSTGSAFSTGTQTFKGTAGGQDLAFRSTPVTANANALVVDTTAPTILSFTSNTANGSYKAGSTIDIRATASKNLISGAQITATLDTGETVTLTRDSTNAALLIGSYVVGTGKTSADLTVTSFTLGTGATAPQDGAGNLISTTVPTGTNNIAGAKDLVIDTTAPSSPKLYAATQVRYVLLKQNGFSTNTMWVNELEVFVNGVNVASKLAVSSKGTVTLAGFTASTLTDGIFNRANGYASSVATTDDWLQVDLGGLYSVDSIKVTALNNAAGTDITNAQNINVYASASKLDIYTTAQLTSGSPPVSLLRFGTTGAVPTYVTTLSASTYYVNVNEAATGKSIASSILAPTETDISTIALTLGGPGLDVAVNKDQLVFAGTSRSLNANFAFTNVVLSAGLPAVDYSYTSSSRLLSITRNGGGVFDPNLVDDIVKSIQFKTASTTQGDRTVSVTYADSAGNTSGASVQVLTVDTTAAAPSVTLQSASDTGYSSSDRLTNDITPTFTVSGELGSTVTLFNDVNTNNVMDAGESLGSVNLGYATQGLLTTSVLAPGTYSNLKAIQTDLASNTSATTTAQTAITIQTVSPVNISAVTAVANPKQYATYLLDLSEGVTSANRVTGGTLDQYDWAAKTFGTNGMDTILNDDSWSNPTDKWNITSYVNSTGLSVQQFMTALRSVSALMGNCSTEKRNNVVPDLPIDTAVTNGASGTKVVMNYYDGAYTKGATMEFNIETVNGVANQLTVRNAGDGFDSGFNVYDATANGYRGNNYGIAQIKLYYLKEVAGATITKPSYSISYDGTNSKVGDQLQIYENSVMVGNYVLTAGDIGAGTKTIDVSTNSSLSGGTHTMNFAYQDQAGNLSNFGSSIQTSIASSSSGAPVMSNIYFEVAQGDEGGQKLRNISDFSVYQSTVDPSLVIKGTLDTGGVLVSVYANDVLEKSQLITTSGNFNIPLQAYIFKPGVYNFRIEATNPNTGMSSNFWTTKGVGVFAGGPGSDAVIGTSNSDNISAGDGVNTITTGAGNDVVFIKYPDFQATRSTTITDFTVGQDKIDVTGYIGATQTLSTLPNYISKAATADGTGTVYTIYLGSGLTGSSHQVTLLNVDPNTVNINDTIFRYMVI